MHQHEGQGLAAYEPTSLDNFLWWLSTAEPELIRDCAVDRNRYRITGVVVLCTWVFATMAWTYFFSTTNTNMLAYLMLGLFMGFIVLTIDRALIKGINAKNKSKAGPLIFRGILALTIGFFMAQPAVLYLFDAEVRMQANMDNEGRRKTKLEQLQAMYAPQQQTLVTEQKRLEDILQTSNAAVEKARTNYLSEADGSGGTGKVGISTIALAKRVEYQKLDEAYKQLQTATQPQLDSLQLLQTAIKDSITVQEKRFADLLNFGFLTRIEALQNLIKSNNAVASRYYLIICILMLIELMPVIAKSMLPDGPYADMIRLTEDNDRERHRRNMQHINSLGDYYNQRLLDADKQAIDHFFETTRQVREAKVEEEAMLWRNDRFTSFDGFWRKMKREWMGRME